MISLFPDASISNSCSSLNYKWVHEFKNEHNRYPRILHIGNIANNAYLNAKIQRGIGIEAYVICYDYSHIMGCPEWEEADFVDGWGNDFAPDWSKVDLQGFKSPEWFVRGGFIECIEKQLKFFDKKPRINKENNSVFKIVYLFIGLLDKAIEKLKNKTVLKLLIIYFLRAYTKIKNFTARVLRAFYRFGIIKNHNNEIELSQYFKGNQSGLSVNELAPYYANAFLWNKVFIHFDLVQAYALDGIYPLLAGKKYIAFEHGTIRNIPFENNTQGRVCALTYRAADNVIITNCDNIRSVEKLGIKNYQFIPHPINEGYLDIDSRALQIRADLKSKYNADFIIFHPARQHWTEERHPDWEKGNDFLIKAFAQFIKNIDSQGFAVFVEWGASVDESKVLIKKLGIEDRVLWIKPLPNREMIRYIHASDIVADQFFLGAFGSTMPKALACKKAVLIYIDESIHQWCFSEMPPVLNAKNEDEIFLQLKHVYLDSVFYNNICEKGYQWYLKYHSNQIILDKTLNVYRELLG